jgi:APA family basic amino acid/polyamine antiporter
MEGHAMHAQRRESTPVPARLGLWDATSLIVGIIIGVGIFQTPSSVFSDAPRVWPALGTWLVGGLLALVGALCFAEMASAYPKSGGEYVYLTRAFGPWVGFIYAWTQLSIIRPGSIGAVAYIFAIHAGTLLQWGEAPLLFVALGAIALLTVINILGVTLGKNTQNILTIIKVLGLVGMLIVGIGWGNVQRLSAPEETPRESLGLGWFANSMIFVLWAYSGWHEAAYIASEVKDNRRNLPLALIGGTVFVTILYLAINIALVLGLGVAGAKSEAAAADLVSLAWPNGGRQAMSVLIMISALGALNGMIFTTARIAVAFGDDYPLFAPLTRWSPTFHTPMRALILEGLISSILVLGVFFFGQSLNIGAAGAMQGNPFDGLIAVTAAVFWFLFLLTGVALFLLRQKDPNLARPFRVPGYPVLPLLFCAWCGYLVVGAINYEPRYSLAGLGIALAGLPFYFLPRWPTKTPAATEEQLPVG